MAENAHSGWLLPPLGSTNLSQAGLVLCAALRDGSERVLSVEPAAHPFEGSSGVFSHRTEPSVPKSSGLVRRASAGGVAVMATVAFGFGFVAIASPATR